MPKILLYIFNLLPGDNKEHDNNLVSAKQPLNAFFL